MEELPSEILHHLITCSNLSVGDVINLSLTCKYLQNEIIHGVETNRIWETLYKRNYPRIDDSSLSRELSWFEKMTHVYKVKKSVRNMLEKLSNEYYSERKIGPSELKGFRDLVENDPGIYSVVMWYLNILLRDCSSIKGFSVVSLFTPGNKTLHYFCRQVIGLLRHVKQEKDHAAFLRLDERHRLLEKVAAFVAQWCQPTIVIDYSDIQQQLDALASEIKEDLLRNHPDHPLFNVSAEILSNWRLENLDAHQFIQSHCRAILTSINNVLYAKYDFKRNPENFYDQRHSFINLVLRHKTGLPILLCIVYESVARRLGVHCEPVIVPSHFLLRFQARSSSFLYLDAANSGALVEEPTRSYASHNARTPMIRRADAITVMHCMIASIETHVFDMAAHHYLLELEFLVVPSNLDTLQNLAGLCMEATMRVQHLREMLLKQMPLNAGQYYILRILNEYERSQNFNDMPPPKTRPVELQYAVGQVIRHRSYECVGVITGWTPQLLYFVLFVDGSNDYLVDEENITVKTTGLEDSVKILEKLDDVGRHFSHFHGHCFVPNASKEREYPQDKAIRENW